ncbi:hypothetical protein Tco_1487528 [Tanacetum coccineum]
MTTTPDLALSTNLNDLYFATLNINGQSTEVEAPPPINPVDDDDDFIDDEDDVPRDLVDSDNEVLANSDDDNEVATVMSAAVMRGHGGDGAGDPLIPLHARLVPVVEDRDSKEEGTGETGMKA